MSLRIPSNDLYTIPNINNFKNDDDEADRIRTKDLRRFVTFFTQSGKPETASNSSSSDAGRRYLKKFSLSH